MLSGLRKNRLLFFPILLLVLAAKAQEPVPLQTGSFDSTRFQIDPVNISLRDPVKPNPLLAQTINRPTHELMYWPNYPLTPLQIEQRDRINNRTVGGQIVHDVIQNTANSIINRKKTRPPATVPRF